MHTWLLVVTKYSRISRPVYKSMNTRYPTLQMCALSEKRLHSNTHQIGFQNPKPTDQKNSLTQFQTLVGTMLYHHTKDIMIVKQKLGHQNITST